MSVTPPACRSASVFTSISGTSTVILSARGGAVGCPVGRGTDRRSALNRRRAARQAGQAQLGVRPTQAQLGVRATQGGVEGAPTCSLVGNERSGRGPRGGQRRSEAPGPRSARGR